MIEQYGIDTWIDKSIEQNRKSDLDPNEIEIYYIINVGLKSLTYLLCNVETTG
jgi:hypothetical protein